MPTQITTIPDAPIVIAHSSEGLDREQDMRDSVVQITAALDAQPEPVFLIIDLSEITMDLNELIQSASLSARGNDTMLHHPKIRENIFVLTSKFIIMAIQGLNSATFGRINARVFATLDEALEYCRAQAAAV